MSRDAPRRPHPDPVAVRGRQPRRRRAHGHRAGAGRSRSAATRCTGSTTPPASSTPSQDDFDVILCDFNLPRFSPYAALQILVARRCGMPLVVRHPRNRRGSRGARAALRRQGLPDQGQAGHAAADHRARDDGAAARCCEQERLGRELAGRLSPAQEALRAPGRGPGARTHADLARAARPAGADPHRHGDPPACGQARHGRRRSRASTPTPPWRWRKAPSKQLKTLSFSLRPAQLDLLGLVAAAQSAVQRIAEPAGLVFNVSARGKEPATLGETASVALRLVQEALNNVVRHAQASHVAVRLRFLPQGRIGVLVVDDGVGFDKQAVAGRPAERAQRRPVRHDRAHRTGRRALAYSHLPGRGVAIRAVL